MTYVNDVSLKVQVDFFVRCVVRAFPFESGSLGSLVTGHRYPPCPAPHVHLVLGLQRHPLHLSFRSVPPISGCRGVSSPWFLPWTIVLLRSSILRTYGGENRGHSDRHVSDDFLQTEWAWMQYGPDAVSSS